MHFQNMKDIFLGNAKQAAIDKLKDFLNKQDMWTRQMISKHGDVDPYWRHVSYIIAQFDGLYDGYKSVAAKDWVSRITRTYDTIVHCYAPLF